MYGGGIGTLSGQGRSAVACPCIAQLPNSAPESESGDTRGTPVKGDRVLPCTSGSPPRPASHGASRPGLGLLQERSSNHQQPRGRVHGLRREQACAASGSDDPTREADSPHGIFRHRSMRSIPALSERGGGGDANTTGMDVGEATSRRLLSEETVS